ncbi:hypothetical protein [Rhodoplanes serenus]|uniref:hypothetical protein n=1 Tax=Rhodoplanes serenus TaxID=200615 RepID=UPI000DAB4F6E|nr:hypothetical protein [Rhodoplanes serenus]RAI34434.1 hypothetical protein CH340_09100 [Rhodoplanes serenus]
MALPEVDKRLRTIAFDPHRRARSPDLGARIAALSAFLAAKVREITGRSRRRTHDEQTRFDLAVEALACNLLTLSLVTSDMRLSVPRDAGRLFGKGSGSQVYGRHFLAVLELMAHPEVALIDQVIGRHGRNGGRTTVAALPALADRLPLGAVQWSDFRSAPGGEVLVRKGPKLGKQSTAPILTIRDTDHVRQLRREIERLNGCLLEAPVEVVAEGDRWTVDPLNRTVRRYFTEGTWMTGGRLFGGFWMNMPRADRFRLVRIDGETVVNVDYDQLFPRLAYARALSEPPPGDLYDISGDSSHRKGWKKLVNAMLFAREPMKAWPDETAQHFPTGTKAKAVYAAVTEKHAPIAHLFWTGIGHRLMFAESNMLVRALDRLFTMGIPALPIHDAVIVAQSHGETALDVLQQTAEDCTGLTAPMVKIEAG